MGPDGCPRPIFEDVQGVDKQEGDHVLLLLLLVLYEKGVLHCEGYVNTPARNLDPRKTNTSICRIVAGWF